MEKFETDGVVLKTGVTGEADLIVYVLTRQRGIIRAFAKGARITKSRLHAGAAAFVYGAFSFTEKNGVFHVNDIVPQEVFFALRLDLQKLSLAQYFCEILLRTVSDTESDPMLLRLFLNSLHLLCGDKKPALMLKAVFELRIAVLSGYAPALVACGQCGEYETPLMFFDVTEGALYCENCAQAPRSELIPVAVISAMRHIVFSDFSDLFRFQLEDALLTVLNRMTERYLMQCFQHRFRLLEFFYQSL